LQLHFGHVGAVARLEDEPGVVGHEVGGHLPDLVDPQDRPFV
jgi:hypothetical protein